VLVALGGGAHILQTVRPLVIALAAAHPDMEIRVAAGFAAGERLAPPRAARVVSAPDGLADELARATVAIVAGGVTLYEACALGVPAVAAAVAASQVATVHAMARAGAARCGGRLQTARDARRVARAAVALLADVSARRAMGRRGRQIVDARGAWRVAAAVRRLADAA
jgi:spore coat polysaccharide biosynthesis predicted glycosyltransferase SpsG